MYPILRRLASQAFEELGDLSPDQALSGEKLHSAHNGTMLTFDYSQGRFVEDSRGALAMRILAVHFASHWRNLVSTGQPECGEG